MNKKFLIFVDVKDGVQSNKFYDMSDNGDGTFTAEYGRVGSSKTSHTYPISKWNSKLNSKLRKGYEDITELKRASTVVNSNSGNTVFNQFFDILSQYTKSTISTNYLVDKCSDAQLKKSQELIDTLTSVKSTSDANDLLLALYKVIPRKMDNVNNYLVSDISNVPALVKSNRDLLKSMDSSNIIHTTDPFKELNIVFEEVSKKELKIIEGIINPSNNTRYKIHKVYKVTQNSRIKHFEKFISKEDNPKTELLIHGTRNPNVLSILKQGLLIRPSNAAYISGAAYGNGVYHSAHTAKSMGYTGRERDAIFLIQDVHIGNPYTYKGWYRDGKDISRSQMNYKDLKSMGYDSLYVKEGDGLLNSEYIVYDHNQTVTKFIVHFKY